MLFYKLLFEVKWATQAPLQRATWTNLKRGKVGRQGTGAINLPHQRLRRSSHPAASLYPEVLLLHHC